jgi:uncharacterized membrane protein YcaP (DUF421 family)
MVAIIGDFSSIAVKSIASALLLFLLTRILGKKQLSQLSFFDYVIGISIGSIAAEIVMEHGLPFYEGLFSMAVWAAIPLAFSFFSLRSIRMRKILDGFSTVLMYDGKIIEENLRRSRFTVNDLLEELRTQEIFDIQTVKLVILETNGKISVLKNPSPAASGAGCFFPLIIDGNIIKHNLNLLSVDKMWVDNQLNQAGITALQDVLLAECDENRSIHLIKKNKNANDFPFFQ